MKSNFPPLFKEFFENILNKILFGGTREEIDKQILDFKNSLSTLPFEKISKPTGVKRIQKYTARGPSADEYLVNLKIKHL